MPLSIESISLLGQRADRAFEKAVSNAGEVVEHEIALPGRHLRLKFAGPALVSSVTRALGHLTCALGEQPDLTVKIWDGASTQTGFPSLPGGAGPLPENGKLVHTDPETGNLVLLVKLESGMVSLVDLQRGQGAFYAPDAAHFPTPEVGAPLLAVIHGLFSGDGALIAHAAAVGTSSGGVLLTGRGGSGKSSTALACVQAGLDYVADDYCLLTDDNGITAHCLYASAKVDDAQLRRLGIPGSAAESRGDNDNKKLLFVNDHWPDSMITSCPIRAVLLPRIRTDAKTALIPVSPAEALRSLAPSTILQLPGASSRLLHLMAQVVQQARCYVLEIGHDKEAPRLIRQLLLELQ